ncbi:MAG: hypothetical protein KGQ59_01860, partial [Bdellovibrionales bacterium]|nr:hypothetical protein [Bdellovibrionales bacterium]
MNLYSRILYPLILLAAVFFPEATWAYIPPSEYIVKTMVQKKSALKHLRARGAVMALTPEGRLAGPRFTEELVF